MRAVRATTYTVALVKGLKHAELNSLVNCASKDFMSTCTARPKVASKVSTQNHRTSFAFLLALQLYIPTSRATPEHGQVIGTVSSEAAPSFLPVLGGGRSANKYATHESSQVPRVDCT